MPAWLIMSRGLRPYWSDSRPISGVESSEHSAYTDTSVVATSGEAPNRLGVEAEERDHDREAEHVDEDDQEDQQERGPLLHG